MTEKPLTSAMTTMLAFIIVVFLALLSCFRTSAAAPRFKVHTIERNAGLVNDSVMMVTLSDLDGDGDLDWTIGTCWPKNKRARTLYWYEHRTPDRWIRHRIGADPAMYGGACTADVNGDGLPDVIAAGLWLNQNKGKKWKFSQTGIPSGAHDLQAVDINQDGKVDFLVFDQRSGLLWFDVPKDPTRPWKRHRIAAYNYAGAKVHATGSPEGAADLDGDGDVDVAAVGGWFENRTGKGLEWVYRRTGLFPRSDPKAFPWGYAVKTAVRDLDRDGDNDIVQSECDTRLPAGLVWMENTDGKGTFQLHWIKQRVPEDFHTLRLLDYDNDGDLDVLSGVGPLAQGRKKCAYLFENLSPGPGKPVRWKEHVVHSGMPIHEGTCGDVDDDGDVDLVLKPWNQKDTPKDFLYLENLVIK